MKPFSRMQIMVGAIMAIVGTLAVYYALDHLNQNEKFVPASQEPAAARYADEFAESLLGGMMAASAGWDTSKPLDELTGHSTYDIAPSVSPNGDFKLHIRDMDDGNHEFILQRIATRAEEPVITIQEADPGSGSSFGYRWSDDSQAIFINGAGKPAGHPRDRGMALVYLIDKKTVYAIDLGPALAARIARVRAAPGAPLAIVPGVGIGPIKLGQPMADVAKALGPPDRGPQGSAVYLSLGVVFQSNRASSTVDTIIIGKTAAAWVTDAVKGSTKEGIHMGSTPADVQAAYGKADVVQNSGGGREEWRYHSGRTGYVFQNGALVAIFLLK